MELGSKYSPAEVEGKWYQYWLDNKLFSSKPDGREPYTIVIPPPNVTGVLHMGHVLNETIQDILVRHARMEGKNACWVPGTDHASIATEAKVVNRLAEQGIKKTDLTREEFLKHAWAWTEEHGGIILKQLRKLGCSCDWDRTAFTMDGPRSESVIKVFVDLYRKGLIYRGVRMVNWDPKALTALSDEEVVYKEEHTKLYYMKYYLAERVPSDFVAGEGAVIHQDSRGYYAVVATTRPETIMGDVAMCINPNDPKNQWLKGKKVIVPVVGRVIPVIEDEYVDIEFGTGCLKVTPAHDVNDYMLGEKYNLEAIDIFNDDATLSDRIATAQQKSLAEVSVPDDFVIGLERYVGMERFACRKQIAEDMVAAGLMEKIEDYDNKIGCSERTGVPIEPKLSMQWFLKMEHMADISLSPVMNDEIQFYPAKYKNTYRHWLENIKDWCISRQLWWGHRIPAWYLPSGGFVVAENEQEALQLAREKSGNNGLQLSDLKQDEDALDTWFSSWLWPISLFDGIRNPGNEEMKYYYPTADLVTGPDIIFFWVARMIMAGYEYEGKMPFKHVYFTGIVRDKLGRKMSKSLGNSPDPLDLIERFGADGVRMGMMLSAPAGNDILFDEVLCEQGRNFNNKIWNAFRLVKGWERPTPDPSRNGGEAGAQLSNDSEALPLTGERGEGLSLATSWFAAKLRLAAEELADDFSKYRLSEALMTVYKLFWDEFSSWYLEMVKPAYIDGKPQPVDSATYEATLQFFEVLLKMLHPFMPFITEELWQALYDRQPGESIMRAELHLPATTDADRQLCDDVEILKQIVAGVRNIRASKNIAPKEKLTLEVLANAQLSSDSEAPSAGGESALIKMANLSAINVVTEKSNGSASFLVGTTEYAVPLGDLIDLEAERKKLESELQHLEGFLANVEKKLQNERFVQNAPAAVVEMERKKQADAQQKIAAIRDTLASL
jgi:valyl-tRNA synthetase